jgi:hypothetical protein
MKLNDFEIQSSTWQKLSEYYRTKLADYRARIENPTMDDRARLALCWQIKVIKELLDHAEPARVMKKADAENDSPSAGY